MRYLIVRVMALAIGATPVAAQRPAVNHATRVATIEGFTGYRLDNGLQVLLVPDSTTPTVTVNVTYMVGSRHEGYGEKGMAHLLEHMLFKGTARRRNIYADLNARGARWNASTAVDRTNYFEVAPATPANVAWMLDLEADRMVNSRVAGPDLTSEMTVVRNEFEAGENDPFNVLLERANSVAYLWHNYAHSTIGARSDIESVPIARLQAFYRKYYQPDNALLVIAGKFDTAQAMRRVESTVGRIPKPVRSLARGNVLYATYTVEPIQDGERSVTLRRTGDIQIALAAYHVPALASPDYAAVAVLAEVLGNEPSGRLYQSLVDTKLAATTGAFATPTREPGLLYCFAEVREADSLHVARTAMLRAIDSLRSHAPTTEEVERARTRLLTDIDLRMRSTEGVGLEFSEWAAAGDWRLLFVHRDALRRVSAGDVQRVAQAYLKPSNVTVGLFYPTGHPDRSEISHAPDVASLVHEVKGDSALRAGEAFDASPQNIDARTVRTTLPNHFRLSLLSKRTRGASVHGLFVLRYGSEQSLAGKQYTMELASAMIERGTTSLSREQLKDSLDKLKANVEVSAGAGTLRIYVEALRPTLPAVMALITDMVTHPAFDRAEFDALKQHELADLESYESAPEFLAYNEFARRAYPLPPTHPEYTPTPAEHLAGIQAVTLEDARQAYGDFLGASAGDLAIVGDFDSAAVLAVVRDRFGHWTSAQPFVRLRRPYRPVDSATVTIQTPDKTNAALSAGVNLSVSDDDPEYAALVMGNYIVGGGPLDSRLAIRIRQREGLSYGVYSSLDIRTADSSGVWAAGAIFAPQNVTRLTSAFLEELHRIVRDGVTDSELAHAKQAWLQDRIHSRANDYSLIGVLVRHREVGRTLAFDAELERRVEAVTPAQVNAALRHFLTFDHLVVIRAGDFATAPAISSPPPTP